MNLPNKYPNAICHWPEEDRPREKLTKYGERALSNSELLAILLHTGVKGESAIDLARRILSKIKTFRQLSQIDPEGWREFKGLGPAKIAQIKAALEIGHRFREEKIKTNLTKIRSSLDIVNILMPRMRDLKHEVFKTIYLDASNQVIDIMEEVQGTINFASPIIREILHKALRYYAVAIICIHNHPSGGVQPSDDDRHFTRKLSEAGNIMGINVLDHIILGNNQFYSFADSGEMGKRG